ncbi:MAG: hypothetical protein KUG75_03175, partial [Pseudomonadales bacterium]|nr:hypothetical protein [Pseudomonadales bacterium]
MYQSIKKYFSVLAITLLVSTPGTAGTLTLDLTNQFSDDPPLSTAGPYGTVIFDDGGTPGSVTMTFTYYGD